MCTYLKYLIPELILSRYLTQRTFPSPVQDPDNPPPSRGSQSKNNHFHLTSPKTSLPPPWPPMLKSHHLKNKFQNTPHLNPQPQPPQPIQHPHDPRRPSHKPHRQHTTQPTSHLIDKAAGLRSPPIARHDPTRVALPIAGSLSPPSVEISHLRKAGLGPLEQIMFRMSVGSVHNQDGEILLSRARWIGGDGAG